MGRIKIELSKKKLYTLYYVQNKPPHLIGKMFGCSFSTITNRLKEYGIPLKTPASARMKYKKYDFSGDLIEKSYLIGFRLGDLAVSKTNPSAETVVVRLHTTHDVQIDLFKNLFKKYGQVSLSKSSTNPSTNLNAFLNKSFEFLLPKWDLVEEWIIQDEKYFCSFAAGYIDAEGTFGIYQERARFKVDSYDKEILFQIHVWLDKNNIINKFFRVAKKGDYVRYGDYHFKKDVWRVNVNDANSLLEFINLINPYIKHKKRRKDLEKNLKNIARRKLKGSIR
ncbi:MAG: hypothetical protein UR46_C0010G0008 [Parcubacteria group bacterium GW2011_GWA1_33_6]|uniref:Homing endonuclease LAGLIDADG domain-containing protein n=1 Tax=Candidatus Staskawiczbacteria bacterium RIFCSPHIGHO2_02_FULL_33_16 TaxID=1802204 RepID=A0A1G2HX20_9BACT|nr:MAG: hypothetical protein UR31_C0005G0002 [Parcubacteria group bacterium GW2011_GWA2_33_14]KKP54985.1 MAG: hypothetical protein UR46_C0010G0008 [Parcubacteria group bacterium GW2011_GWA1_33_6]OGZ67086.1 MAG: hypothetical protein A3D34_01765 [Candidatus Staskawiczbacteria bacterium RIFCSPHIGHO2_02_FULL_33_16]OGZ69984.1 MAG: hypothetical protein A2980_03390 [Candidatus Staskawiczbacteria bacterium RIFCSPLOWO2_01_FULL_33_13]